jgi:hypothetical protein
LDFCGLYNYFFGLFEINHTLGFGLIILVLTLVLINFVRKGITMAVILKKRDLATSHLMVRKNQRKAVYAMAKKAGLRTTEVIDEAIRALIKAKYVNTPFYLSIIRTLNK